MKLPSLEELDIDGKRVLVRVDLDYKEKSEVTKREKVLLPTLDFISQRASETILLGHKGRPGGKEDSSLSLKETSKKLTEFLKKEWGEEKVTRLNMYVMENLRFNKGEESNDLEYAEHLAEKGDFYVNEAFATSHREHTSIVTLPRLLPHAAGFRFIEEVENLSKVLVDPKRPLISIISGVKEDKLHYLEDFKKFSDKVLIAGRLPDYLGDAKGEKQEVARLLPDKEDITIHSIERFEEEIAGARTIVVSGPMGRFEEAGHRQGTQRVLTAVAESSAFKVAGGGDTERAIAILKLSDKFDWISVGGGAMLEFLAKGTLPGIQALLN